MVHEGRCLCGTVSYAVASPPVRVTFCHCRFCQRATGSAYLVEAIFKKEDVSVLNGNPAVYQHVSTGSGKNIHIYFCSLCGTKLYLSLERFPDVLGVYAGTFDDPNWFDRTAPTTKHIFLDVAQCGTIIPAGVNTFREHASSPTGEAIEPHVFTQPHTIR
jgi:hypothetical protein